MPRPTHRKLHAPLRRDRRLVEAPQCRTRPHQLDVHNREGPRQNGPRLSQAGRSICITSTSQNLCDQVLALVRNDQSASAQTQQVATCNALHELEERLSRWLLQTRDLVRSDTLPLTQEFLSQMLGVQRSSVTSVARKLQEAGLIDCRRGRIDVLDIEGSPGQLLRVLRGD